MSYDENDAAMDAFYDDMRGQFYPEIISEFTTDRLQSYYLEYPETAKPAYLALEEALRLRDFGFLSAAFLFAIIATEVAMKNILLKPIVQGLIHNVPTSTLIADIVIERKGFADIKKLLFEALSNIASVDLNSFHRPACNQTLWEEITNLQTKRNKLVHQAQLPSPGDTEIAIAVADSVLNIIFPKVIEAINLHVHEYGLICNDMLCKLELSPARIVSHGVRVKLNA